MINYVNSYLPLDKPLKAYTLVRTAKSPVVVTEKVGEHPEKKIIKTW